MHASGYGPILRNPFTSCMIAEVDVDKVNCAFAITDSI